MNLTSIINRVSKYDKYFESIKIISVSKTQNTNRYSCTFEYKGTTYGASLDADTDEVCIQSYGNLPSEKSFLKALINQMLSKDMENSL